MKDPITGTLAAEYVVSGGDADRSMIIPDNVSISGRTVPVISIGEAACFKNKRLKSVTIGANVQSIGRDAFKKCKKLKNIIIKSAALQESSVDKTAFKGIKKKAKFSVPSGYAQTYKWLKKKGAKKAKVL